MIELKLKDCQIDKEEFSENPTQLIYRIRGCEALNEAFLLNNIEIFSLKNSKYNAAVEKPIEYRLDTQNASKAYFTTSRYVGFYISGEISIRIEPRFGNAIRNHLFAHALELYLPRGDSGNESSVSNNLWLIALLWRANAEKALTKSQIPKIYKKIEKNQTYFRGRLNIQKQIKHNSVDESRFYCAYSKFSYDNTINQVVRYCYRILAKEKEYINILKGFVEHDEMLADFGVSNNPVSIQEINKIVYTPMTKYYKPLMELSKTIINFKSFQNSSNVSKKSGFSVFLDMAEIWENYLYNLLVKNLDDYDVENPNLTGDYPLFSDGSRKVRPDILIRKNNQIVAIIDAKYKYYTQIGQYSNQTGAVSREDLYQMNTYLNRFGNKNCIGIFVTPFEEIEEIKTINNGLKQKIGLLGLAIDSIPKDDEKESLVEILQREQSFIQKLVLLLEDVPLDLDDLI